MGSPGESVSNCCECSRVWGRKRNRKCDLLGVRPSPNLTCNGRGNSGPSRLEE